MKYSQSLIKTLREAPSDAEVMSHQLLIRAGFIRKVAAGIYEYLPLGLRSIRKVEAIVRDELNKAGCQEVLLPHLVPAELWQESERWGKYGPELLRLTDRHDREYCFGPTHEETISDLVRHSVSSYKAFPFNLYQIQTKFRDEIRPRFGLMRGREFIMKDAYSFHTNEDDLDREYQKMHQAYSHIFKRCGLECRPVDADTGAIGGSSSHEFMVLAETGEDLIAICQSCEYAANLEKAHFKVSCADPTTEALEEVHTPNLKTIDDVSSFLKVSPEQMIKTLVYKWDEGFVVACLAGHRELNEIKLQHLIPGDELRLATDDEILQLTGVPTGFLGPVGLMDLISDKESVRLIFDHSISCIADAVTGSNKKDYHSLHVNLTRDVGENLEFADFSNVLEKDACPQCDSGALKLIRGIEVGHIFKLGDRYAKPMKINYLDQNGKEQTAIMGTYGIGIGRTMAASVEQNHDDKGIIWPRALAPYDCSLITLDETDEILSLVQELRDGFAKLGFDTLWDDRNERAGVKFNDADLIGIPMQIVIGKRGMQNQQIEYKIRGSGEKGFVPLTGALEQLVKILNGL